MNINGFGGYDVFGVPRGYSAPQVSFAMPEQSANSVVPEQSQLLAASNQPNSALQPPGTAAQQKAFANAMNAKLAGECQTCKNRKYQDGSNDAGVSFQTPQHINPAVSGAVVAAHEQEHVTREQAKAESEGNEVVSQTVQLHGAMCPECGRYYIAGGTTTTSVKSGGEHSGHNAQDANRKAMDIVA